MRGNSDNFKVCPAGLKDSRRVWEIRSHPICRQYSGNSEVISFANHQPWFKEKYFSRRDNYCFVLDNAKGKVLGYCRLDFDDANGYYIISIAIDPDMRSRGLGHLLLSKTLRQFIGKKEIFAEIQKENIPSMKLFKKNNFKIFGENKKNYYLKYKPFHERTRH